MRKELFVAVLGLSHAAWAMGTMPGDDTGGGGGGGAGWTAMALVDDTSNPRRAVYHKGNDRVVGIHYDAPDKGWIVTQGAFDTSTRGGAVFQATGTAVEKVLFSGDNTGLTRDGGIEFTGLEKTSTGFVAMAHALPEARSILCLRATRAANATVASNIRWSYGHTTIPRHLRDIVVTEYGIADLRGKTDHEVVTALIGIMDARFQDAFVADAQRAAKLPRTYRVAEAARANRPELLARRFAPWRQRGLFTELPFGSDFTDEETVLAAALKSLAGSMQSWPGRLALAREALQTKPADARLRPYLERMALSQPASLRERIESRLLATCLQRVLASR
jgi:hypothetical protein